MSEPVSMAKWYPTTNPHHLRRLGKSIEELGELIAVLARIQIQGIDSIDPASGKTNRQRMHEETGDVLAQFACNLEVFDMDTGAIDERTQMKVKWMEQWEAHFTDEQG